MQKPKISKQAQDYRRSARYDVLLIADKEELIKLVNKTDSKICRYRWSVWPVHNTLKLGDAEQTSVDTIVEALRYRSANKKLMVLLNIWRTFPGLTRYWKQRPGDVRYMKLLTEHIMYISWLYRSLSRMPGLCWYRPWQLGFVNIPRSLSIIDRFRSCT